ncbi:MAG: nucleotidyltransferase family protein [Anaerolineales bacterium]|nr:nucleotidyltransferase family protein [Anaerolineales bacterium]
MDVIITTGGIPAPGEPLIECTQGQPKAMLEIGGKPMLQWVLDAFIDSPHVKHIVLVGLTDLQGLTCSKSVSLVPDQHDMLANIRAGLVKSLEVNPYEKHVLMAASDIPAITAPMVNWVVENTARHDADLIYNVVRRETMEARFPSANRTYIRLRDGDFCGGDLGTVRADLALIDRSIWQILISQRKNPVRQALTVGLDTLLGVITRTSTLEQTVRRACRSLQIQGVAVECPFAEMAMDIDKPHQLEIMRADFDQG